MTGALASYDNNLMCCGSSDRGVVRVLASHQCVPGSIPGPGVICGLSLSLVLFLSPRGFSLSTPVFPSPQKLTSKFQFDLDYCQALNHEPVARVIAQALACRTGGIFCVFTQALPVFDIKFAFTFTSAIGTWIVMRLREALYPLRFKSGRRC